MQLFWEEKFQTAWLTYFNWKGFYVLSCEVRTILTTDLLKPCFVKPLLNMFNTLVWTGHNLRLFLGSSRPQKMIRAQDHLDHSLCIKGSNESTLGKDYRSTTENIHGWLLIDTLDGPSINTWSTSQSFDRPLRVKFRRHVIKWPLIHMSQWTLLTIYPINVDRILIKCPFWVLIEMLFKC